MERWVGKVAVVTGASSGIGEAVSRALVASGLNVLGLARREDKLKELTALNNSSQGKFRYMKCDLRNESDIFSAFEFVDKNLGGVDVLVNNAGTIRSSPLAAVKTSDIHDVVDLNLVAPSICIREALKSMRSHKNEAHIFNVNSVYGVNATFPPLPINLYPASKFGLRALSDVLKQEIRHNKDKIRVTGLYPGLVKTELIPVNGLSSDIYKIGPYLEAKDVADCLIFALSAPSHMQIDDMVIYPVRR